MKIQSGARSFRRCTMRVLHVTSMIIARNFSGHITINRRGDRENGRQFIEIVQIFSCFT